MKLTEEWLAGFIDGEGHLGIARHGNEYLQPRFRINQRDDDSVLVRAVHKFLGVGNTAVKRCERHHKYWSPRARNQLALTVVGKDCLRVVEVLDRAPLRSKKQREYIIWRRAVVDYSTHQTNRWADPSIKRLRDARMRGYKEGLEKVRQYPGGTK